MYGIERIVSLISAIHESKISYVIVKAVRVIRKWKLTIFRPTVYSEFFAYFDKYYMFLKIGSNFLEHAVCIGWKRERAWIFTTK